MPLPAAPIAGASGCLYVNWGTPTAPTWVLWQAVRDVESQINFEDNNVTARLGGGAKSHEPGSADLPLSFTVLHDPFDPVYNFVHVACRNKSYLDIMALDWRKDEIGSSGWRCFYKVFTMNQKQPVEGQQETTFDLKPCYPPFVNGQRTTITPYYVVVGTTPF